MTMKKQGADQIIPNFQKNKIRLIQAKIEGDMATKKDLKDLEKLKKLYPSMF